jgi:nitroreductase
MDALTCLRERKTCRGFLQKEIDTSLLEAMLTDATWAPSASNQQPWHFHVIEGDALKCLNQAVKQAHQEKHNRYDPSKGKTIPLQYVERTKKLFRGIRPFIAELGDGHATFIESGSFRFYDAPTVVLITMHRDMPPVRYMDIGMASQNLMLSAHARGLGTCAIALTLMYEEAIRENLNLSADMLPALFIAIGYTDRDFAVNNFRSTREDVKTCITRHNAEHPS